MKSNLILFGRIQKVSGNEGNVILKVLKEIDITNIEFLFAEIEGTYIPFKIKSTIYVKKNNLNIKFTSINSNIDAAEIVSKNIFIEKKFYKNNTYQEQDIIGYTIIDEDLCELGKVSNILKNDIQILIEVKKKNIYKSSQKTFFIPYVDEFIIRTNTIERNIYVKNMWKIVK